MATQRYSVQYWLIPLSRNGPLPPGLGTLRHPGHRLPTPQDDQRALAHFRAMTGFFPGIYEMRQMYWPDTGPHDVSVRQKVIGRWTVGSIQWPTIPNPGVLL